MTDASDGGAVRDDAQTDTPAHTGPTSINLTDDDRTLLLVVINSLLDSEIWEITDVWILETNSNYISRVGLDSLIRDLIDTSFRTTIKFDGFTRPVFDPQSLLTLLRREAKRKLLMQAADVLLKAKIILASEYEQLSNLVWNIASVPVNWVWAMSRLQLAEHSQQQLPAQDEPPY